MNFIQAFCNRSVPFKSDRDIPNLKDRVILVTGGNIGLGKQSVLEYAKHNPAQIWLAARNTSKAQAALDDIKLQLPTENTVDIQILELDLSSLESVKRAANKFLNSSGSRLRA